MELSTSDILFFLSLAAGIALAVWAPGWAALGWAFAHRRRARTGRASFWSFAGGSAIGVAVSIGVAVATWGLADAVGGGGALACSVLLSWVACWLLAWGVGRRSSPAASAHPAASQGPVQRAVQAEGWGR